MRLHTPSAALPIPVARALRKLGHDIRDARRRRRIPVALLSERASISRMTLNKIEKGDPGVSFGRYATVLFSLGMAGRLADVADPRHDAIGRELEEEHLPQRIRLPRQQKRNKPKGREWTFCREELGFDVAITFQDTSALDGFAPCDNTLLHHRPSPCPPPPSQSAPSPNNTAASAR